MFQLHERNQEVSQSRSALWKFAWAACLAVACLLLGGCGRSADLASQDEIERIKAERRKTSAEEGMAYQNTVAEKLKAKAEAKAEIEHKRQLVLTQKNKSAFTKRNKNVKRPEAYNNWKKRDYYMAKAEADPRLVEAVEYLGNEFVGDAHAAQLLAELLLPGLPKGMSDIKIKATRGSDNELTEALVRALLKNHTEPALNGLKKSIARQPSGDGATVAQKVLQCLARNPDEQSEPIILEALLNPPKPVEKSHNRSPARRQTRNARGTQQLLRVARAAMANGASEEFRVKLARRIVKSGLPLEYSEQYSDILMEPWPENLSAQMVLFDDHNAPKHRRTSLQEQWAVYSSQALARLYGLGRASRGTASQGAVSRAKSKPTDQAKEAAAADPRLVARVMEKLWSKTPTSRIEDRLYRADSIDDVADTILLAATIPRDSVRKSLHDVITRNWRDGPKALAEIGFFDGITYEPGFWLVLKSCRFASSGHGDKQRSKSKRSRPVKNAASRRQKRQDPWQARTVELLLANCGRMEKAANARRLLARQKGGETPKRSPAEDFPIKPRGNPRLVAEYRLAWPDDVENPRSELLPDGTKLWYAKFNQTAEFEVIVAHYRGRMKSPRQHLGPKGCWLESLVPLEGAGRLRSIDVVIQRTPSTIQVSTGAGERLLIDILAVEIENPAGISR